MDPSARPERGAGRPASPTSPPHPVQIFLGIFRSWLRLVATCFSLAAMCLRLLGTGATVLSGAVAFTVVFSIALSVLSALLTVAATAADAIAALLR